MNALCYRGGSLGAREVSHWAAVTRGPVKVADEAPAQKVEKPAEDAYNEFRVRPARLGKGV